MENNYSVYIHINKTNNKKYVGITKQKPTKRQRKDGKGYKGCTYFWNAICKYGWEDFNHEILLEYLSKEEVCLKEKEFIIKYKTTQRDYGYNIEKGGLDKNRFTPEAIKKLKESHKGKIMSEEQKKKISKSLGQGKNNVNYGRKQSEEAKLHNSLAKKGSNHPNWGKHLSNETKEKIKKGNSKPVFQCDLDGEIIKEWESAKYASSILNYSYKAINNCLIGKSKTSFGYTWKYKNTYEKPSTTIPEMGVD